MKSLWHQARVCLNSGRLVPPAWQCQQGDAQVLALMAQYIAWVGAGLACTCRLHGIRRLGWGQAERVKPARTNWPQHLHASGDVWCCSYNLQMHLGHKASGMVICMCGKPQYVMQVPPLHLIAACWLLFGGPIMCMMNLHK